MRKKTFRVLLIAFAIICVTAFSTLAVFAGSNEYEQVYSIYNGQTDISNWVSNADGRLSVVSVDNSNCVQHIPMNKGISIKSQFSIANELDNEDINNLYLVVEAKVDLEADDLVSLPYYGSSGPGKRLTIEVKAGDGKDTNNHPKFSFKCDKAGGVYTPNLKKGWQTFYLPFSSAISTDESEASVPASIENLKKVKWFGLYAANDRDEGSDFVDGKDITISLKNVSIARRNLASAAAKAQNPETGDSSIVLLLIAAIVSGVGIFVTRKRLSGSKS